MALVFAALTPHSPLLLEHLGKEKTKELEQTTLALTELKHELYAARCDTIIVISSHAGEHDNVFTVLGGAAIAPDLSDFGDLKEYGSYSVDTQFISGLRERIKQDSISLGVVHNEHMDYASAIPLMHLTESETSPKVVVIGTSEASRKAHFDFGYIIKDLILNSPKRYGIIISSDLAHTLQTDAPSGFSPFGEKFDSAVRKHMTDYNSDALLKMNEQLAVESQQCALPALLVFLGIMQRVNYTYKELAYQHPFGVGYLTAQFIL